MELSKFQKLRKINNKITSINKDLGDKMKTLIIIPAYNEEKSIIKQ